jgi:hypothetical protein
MSDSAESKGNRFVRKVSDMTTTRSTSIKFSTRNDCSGHSLEVELVSADECRITASHYADGELITANITVDRQTLLELRNAINLMLSA